MGEMIPKAAYHDMVRKCNTGQWERDEARRIARELWVMALGMRRMMPPAEDAGTVARFLTESPWLERDD